MKLVKKKSKKTVLGIAAAVSIVALGAILFLYISNLNPTRDFNPQYTANQETSAIPDKNDATIETTEVPNTQTSEQIPQSNTGSLEIVNLNQSAGFVNAEAKVSNFSTSRCVYQFESEGARPVVRETSGGCGGVSIPQVEFDKIGSYTLIVTAFGADAKLTTSREINIR